MTITQHISIDLQQPGNMPMVHAVQGDEYTRVVEIDLYSGGVAWNPPSGCECVIRYGKPDGKGGIYGTLPDETSAWSIDGNTISVILAPQMLTVPGIVKAQVALIVDQKQIVSTFHFAVNVEEDSSKGAGKSENYVNWKTYYIPQTKDAVVGQYLQITKVDAEGRVIEVTPVDAPSGGGIDGDLDMKGCNVERVGSLDFEPSNDDYSQAFWMQAGGDIKNDDGTNTAVAEFYSSESDLPVVLRHIANGMQADDAVNVAQLKTRLVAPIKATVGQYIQITAVDENGTVTAVEAVDEPSGSGISTEAANLLITILRAVGVYATDQSDNIAALQAALAAGEDSGGGDGGGGGTTPDNPPDAPPDNDTPVYMLEQATTFDGQTTVDTGYNLFDRDKDWTICVTARIDNGPGYAFSAKADTVAARYPAIAFRRLWEKYVPFCYGYAEENSGFAHNAEGIKVVLTRSAGAGQHEFATMYFVKDGAVEEFVCGSNNDFIPISDSSIMLGGCIKADGTVIDYMEGEISDFRVYERVLTADEIGNYLEVSE